MPKLSGRSGITRSRADGPPVEIAMMQAGSRIAEAKLWRDRRGATSSSVMARIFSVTSAIVRGFGAGAGAAGWGCARLAVLSLRRSSSATEVRSIETSPSGLVTKSTAPAESASTVSLAPS